MSTGRSQPASHGRGRGALRDALVVPRSWRERDRPAPSRWILVFAIVVAAAVPGVAFAQTGSDMLDAFATLPALGALGAAVVAVAFLVNRYARDKRKHVRRTVIVLALYVA